MILFDKLYYNDFFPRCISVYNVCNGFFGHIGERWSIAMSIYYSCYSWLIFFFLNGDDCDAARGGVGFLFIIMRVIEDDFTDRQSLFGNSFPLAELFHAAAAAAQKLCRRDYVFLRRIGRRHGDPLRALLPLRLQNVENRRVPARRAR